MAYEILTESYGRRLPKITAEADSTDDLATLGTNYAEGSTCVIGDKTYSLDKVQGWVEPGSGGGGDAKVADHLAHFTVTENEDEGTYEITDFDLPLSELDSTTGESYLAVVKIVDDGGYLSRTKMADFDSDYFEFFVFTPSTIGAPNLMWFKIVPDWDDDTWKLTMSIYEVTIEDAAP